MDDIDVVVLGGGLAGSALARQLRRARPRTRILVVEKRRHPVPEAAFKVGESTVEIGAHYLGEVLGLREHMKTAQLRKFGLRYFFTAGDNRDIARRIEVGPSFFPLHPSYQIDRGRFENLLVEENRRLGIDFVDDCAVERIELGEREHAVELRRGGRSWTARARWVVDASGRASLLKRQLGLAREVGHHANAAWFRIADVITVDDWSEDREWRARVPQGLRRLSTVHLMGRGYWVWLIPLASGATSVGIVADPRLHPCEEFSDFERALAWLRRHEPRCAEEVERRRDRLEDFLVARDYAHGCRQVFSPDRWCIVGEAGVFADPFYSPGSDFIAIANTFSTGLIARELDGGDIARLAEETNRIYLSQFEALLLLFEGQYPLMGNPQVMTAKVVWDFAAYWGFNALLFFHGRLCDLDFLASIRLELGRILRLGLVMQGLFRDWDERWDGETPRDGGFVDYGRIEFLYDDLHCGLDAGLSEPELRVKLAENVDLLERLAAEIFRRAAATAGCALDGQPVNPYALSLRPERWREEGLFAAPGRPAGARIPGLERIWLDGGA